MPDPSAYPHYLKMHEALAATGRAIVHNVKGVPGGGCAAAAGRAVSNMRRCGNDIGDAFGSAVGEFLNCAENGDPDAGPGFWNDADSLEVGNGKQSPQPKSVDERSVICTAHAIKTCSTKVEMHCRPGKVALAKSKLV